MGQKHQELRCFCSRHPLLATYGIDSKGRLYVHVRVFKQARLFGEVIAFGDVKLHCRECLRWHTVVIKQAGDAELREETALPAVVNEG